MATTQLPVQGVFDKETGSLLGLSAPGSQELLMQGPARVLPPQPFYEPELTSESVTISWGPTSQANAYSEYGAMGTPSYRFDSETAAANNKNRLGTDGLIFLSYSAGGANLTLQHGLQVISSVTGFASGAGDIVFVTSAQTVTLVSCPNTTLKARVLVDGKRVPGSDSAGILTGTVATTSNAPNWITLTFPDERSRVISYRALNIRSIFVPTGKYIAPPLSKKAKLLACGDSFASRIAATGEGSFIGALNEIAGKSLGLDVVSLAKGGTGFVNPGTNYNYRTGFEWLAAQNTGYAPDYLWLYGSGNDLGQPNLDVAVADTIRSAFNVFPSLKKIVVTGVYGGFNTDANAAALSASIKAGVQAVGDGRVVYVPVHGPEAAGDPMYWGNGSVPSPANDGGNADLYFSNASQGAGDRHCNRAGVLYGADYMAKRLYAALQGKTL